MLFQLFAVCWSCVVWLKLIKRFLTRMEIFIREWEKEWGLNGFDFQAIKQYWLKSQMGVGHCAFSQLYQNSTVTCGKIPRQCTNQELPKHLC